MIEVWVVFDFVNAETVGVFSGNLPKKEVEKRVREIIDNPLTDELVFSKERVKGI